MNTGEMHEALDAYVDGTMSPEERRDFEARLESDADLRAELGALRRILAGAGTLPESVETARDLWPGIESRIRSERVVIGRFGVRKRRLLAAAAMFAVFVAGLATGLRKSAPPPAEPIALGGDPIVTPGPYAELEREYSAASQDLMAVLGQRPDRLDAETVELIRRNLEIIDAAVREIRGALEEEPANPQLNQLLTGEYRRRSALLRQAADLPGTI
jgi:hypothetical protein